MTNESRIEVRNSFYPDIKKITENMRQSDVEELKPFKLKPYEALLFSFVDSTECFTVLLNDVPVAMFGVCDKELPHGWGNVWLLGTPELEKIPHNFVRQGKKYIRKFLQKYDILFNLTSSENLLYIRWLILTGFKFSKHEIPVNKKMNYKQFYITKKMIKGNNK